MWNLKIQQTSEYNNNINNNNKNQTHRYGKQASGDQWGEGSREGQDGRGEQEIKISCKDLLCNTGKIANILQ